MVLSAAFALPSGGSVAVGSPAAAGAPAAAEAPLRILHVFRAPLGGLYRHVMDVARGQIARGHEVGIFCDSSTGGARADTELTALEPELALGLHRMPIRRSLHARDAGAVWELAAYCRGVRPTVLHGHGSKGGAYARLVSVPGLDAVRAYTPHGGSFNHKPGSLIHRIYMQAESVLARRTDVFLFESAFVKRRFEETVGSSDRLVRVVHNGIDEAEFAPLERIADPFDLVYIGELRAAKGIETLIDALSMIRAEHGRRLTLLVVGSGPSGKELIARTKTAGVWDSIAFVPAQPIRAALARGRIMVIPSKAESLPYVILEAAAAGQPLVSTNVGGIGEIFGPFGDQLIPPGDPGLLAASILAKVDETEEVRSEKAAELSRYVKGGFRIDKMVDDGIAAYREALAARRHAGR